MAFGNTGDVTVGGDAVARDKIVQTIYNYQIVSPAEVGAGFLALRELSHHSTEARDAVLAFRGDFQAVRAQLKVLRDYKALHDVLHQLQIHCYNPIVTAEARLSKDETALDDLQNDLLALLRLRQGAEEVVARGVLAKSEIAWVGDLAKAGQELKIVVDGGDAKTLRGVIGLLRRLLALQPSRLNSRLTSAARALRLPALLQALETIQGRLEALQLNAEKQRQFQDGVVALTGYNQALEALLDAHDRWQDTEDRLRLLETEMDNAEFDFRGEWDLVRTEAEGLYLQVQADWALEIAGCAQRLDQALQDANPPRLRRAFKDYCRNVTLRFFQVDSDFKQLAERLVELDEPLDLVLN